MPCQVLLKCGKICARESAKNDIDGNCALHRAIKRRDMIQNKSEMSCQVLLKCGKICARKSVKNDIDGNCALHRVIKRRNMIQI